MGPTKRGDHPGRPPNQSKKTVKQQELKAHAIDSRRIRLPTNLEQINLEALTDGDGITLPLTNTAVLLPNIPTSNSFDALSSSERATASAMEGETVDEVHVVNTPKIPRNPPIIVTSKNVSAINTICDEIVASKKYTVKIIHIGTRLDVVEKNEHGLLKDALTVKGFEFFTYQSKETKMKKIALKGLYSMDDLEIKELLASFDVVPEDIKPLKLRYGNILYILYFKNNSIKLGDLRKIEYINRVRVYWEFFENRRHNILPQCRNCQMFGHNSFGCKRKSRCLVCSGFHATKNCEERIPKDELAAMNVEEVDRSKIRCVNCGQQHTANYMGCPDRKNFEELQSKISQKQNSIRPNLSRSINANNIHISGPPRSEPQQHYNPPRSSPQQFSNPPRTKQTFANVTQGNAELFTSEELGTIWREMIFGLKNCKTKMEQVLKLGDIVTKYLYTLSV